ncbi:MAG TPA: type II toxin-antitoxin system death-on-curing family toxin [Blastocatellia bacterium]|nr:type II toxin-antitoxin system death-on-curing family toxin [Blastocatellia bacterium]
MAIEPVKYISFPEAVWFHLRLMREVGEIRYGVDDRTLIESALARPQQAAHYENASLLRQAATMCLGLIKNHPWKGGNKRTATFLMKLFLHRNGIRWVATVNETIDLVLNIEADLWKVDEIEAWLRVHTSPLK